MAGRHHQPMDLGLRKVWDLVIEEKPGVLKSMGLQKVRHD